ncbi:MAG: hypothetical protein ACSHWN_04880 [Methylophilaceae bacterium]
MVSVLITRLKNTALRASSLPRGLSLVVAMRNTFEGVKSVFRARTIISEAPSLLDAKKHRYARKCVSPWVPKAVPIPQPFCWEAIIN